MYGTLKITLGLQTSPTSGKRILLLRRYNLTIEEAKQIAQEFLEWNQLPPERCLAFWSADAIYL